MESKPEKKGSNKEVLIAWLPNRGDLAILQKQKWYRIPVTNKPKAWTQKYLAFYQPKAFGEDAYKIRYFGSVVGSDIVKRREIFPNELEWAESKKEYFRFYLDEVREREQPIPSLRPRRTPFFTTTWEKFQYAEQINDLFDDSPLEDLLWGQLKKLEIKAERQWLLPVEKRNYYLDFAVFCNKGFMYVETDGDSWHIRTDGAAEDNRRNNAMASMGWEVLRFTTKQIMEEMQSYCVHEIGKTIKQLGGLSDDGLVPRVFSRQGNQSVQQLSLFEQRAQYGKTLYSGADENLE